MLRIAQQSCQFTSRRADKVRSSDSMSEQLSNGISLRKQSLQIINQIDNM